jgi:hypothetical protein
MYICVCVCVCVCVYIYIYIVTKILHTKQYVCTLIMIFITEMKSVYSAVRTGSLNKAACASSLKG